MDDPGLSDRRPSNDVECGQLPGKWDLSTPALADDRAYSSGSRARGSITHVATPFGRRACSYPGSGKRSQATLESLPALCLSYIFSLLSDIDRERCRAVCKSWYSTIPKLELSLQLQKTHRFFAHVDRITACAFSTDGAHLASGSWDHLVRVWDTKTWQNVTTLAGHSDCILTCVFSPIGHDLLASGGYDNTVILWCSKTWKKIHVLEHPCLVHAIAFSPSEQHQLATGCLLGRLFIWSAESGACQCELQLHDDLVRQCSYTVDGQLLVTCSDDKKICVVRTCDWKTCDDINALQSRGGMGDWMMNIALSPDGRHLASACHNNIFRVWRMGDWSVVQEMHLPFTMWCCKFSPDGVLLAAGFDNGIVKIWHTETWCCLKTMQDHASPVYSLDFAPDSRTLVTASFDHTITVYR